MKKIFGKTTIIPVTDEEAELVRMAEKVQVDINRREQSETPPGMICPMTFYETDMEKTVMGSFMELKKSYREKNGLTNDPILVPQESFSQQRHNPVVQFHPCVRHSLTDMEMAQIFLQRVTLRRRGETLFIYNGRYYEQLDNARFHAMIYGELRDELSVDGSSRRIKSVATAIMAEPEIEVSGTEQVPFGLCLQNGILDLSTFTLREHSARYFFTWMMPVTWRGPQGCPEFDRFLHTVTGGDPILLQRFWEALGYILVPADNRAKRFVVMIGYGDTGKSVFGEVIRAFFAPQDVGSVDIFKMGDRFSLSMLVYKLVNISMDLSNSALNEQAVSTIKQITGRDLVQVEEKYKTPYAAVIPCKLVFGTNHALRIGSRDQAFARRVLYLPFNYPIPLKKQDHYLAQKLVAELPGILYKALQAYRTLVARDYVFAGDEIYNFAHAFQPAEQTVDRQENIEDFIRQHCVEVEGSFVTTDALHKAYLMFCQEQRREGIQNKQEFSTKFNASIKCFTNVTRTKKRVEGVPCNGYMGLQLH